MQSLSPSLGGQARCRRAPGRGLTWRRLLSISHHCCFFPCQRLCLNGSTGQEVIISSGLETVEALAFDPLSQLLYWVDAGLKKIEVGVVPCPYSASRTPARRTQTGPVVRFHSGILRSRGWAPSLEKEEEGWSQTLLCALKGPQTKHRHLPSRFHEGA